MSIVGPRPLLVKYLTLYSEEQHHRHDARPGLTGLAQINGRNEQTWDNRFDLDVKYTHDITLKNDFKIAFRTFKIVVNRKEITTDTTTTYTMNAFTGKDGD